MTGGWPGSGTCISATRAAGGRWRFPRFTDRGGEPGSLVADVRVLAELARVLRAVQGR